MPVNSNQLFPDEALGANQQLLSANGRYTLVYQGDGNLVLYKNFLNGDRSAIWDTGTGGRPAGVCVMQGDGNLVIYGPDGGYIWDSSTHDNPRSRLVMQDDGNAVIYRSNWVSIWASNTWQPPFPPTSPVAQGNDMLPGEVLMPGRFITSANSRYTLTYQGDGNLVLYKNFLNGDRRAIWTSNTGGRPAGVCVMQHDGNLVIYGPDGSYIWDSSSHNNPLSRLIMQDDGNAVIFRTNNTRAWATNTPQPPFPPTSPVAQGDDMQPGEVLLPNNFITSVSGRYTLIYQSDCNLVLYKNFPGAGRRAIWASNTAGRPAGVCVMQHDGNLVIYGPDGSYIWGTSTHQNPLSRLVMQNDGNAVIYRTDNQPIWSTDTWQDENAIIIKSGIPNLEGSIQVVLKTDGTVEFHGHVHNGGIQSFAFRVRVVIRGENTAVAMVYEGHVGGWQAGSNDPRDEYWTQTFNHPLVKFGFNKFINSYPEIQTESKGDITGFLEDVGVFLGRMVIGFVVLQPAVLAVVVLGVGVGSLFAGGLSTGARIIGSTLWLAGPNGTLIALIAEGVAQIGSQERAISEQEYNWAKTTVFRETLPPREDIILTDSVGGDNRPFAFPRFDGKMTLNLGSSVFANPLNFKSTLVHELVHAWQYRNDRKYLEYVWTGIAVQVCHSLGLGDNPYNLPPGAPPFSELGLEQQAEAVEKWFINGKVESYTDPYYKYIAENIRTGMARP